MSHFAEIDGDNKVIRVLRVEQEYIDTGALGDPSKWIQTSYNTWEGQHRLGGTPLRKNYAGPGYTYDEPRDAFIPPQPYPSWTLNEETCQWEHANMEVPVVEGKYHLWDENIQNWKAYDDGEA